METKIDGLQTELVSIRQTLDTKVSNTSFHEALTTNTSTKDIEDNINNINQQLNNGVNMEKWAQLLYAINEIAADVSRLKYTTNNFY